jgi:hypothetical protein
VVEFGIDGVTSDKVRTNSTTFVNPKKLIANITIAPDAIPDRYDVTVTTSKGKRGIGIERFEVTLRQGRSNLYTLTFGGDLEGTVTGVTLDYRGRSRLDQPGRQRRTRGGYQRRWDGHDRVPGCKSPDLRIVVCRHGCWRGTEL